MPSFLRKLFESSHRWLQDASQVTSSANTTVKLPRQALGKRFKSKKKPQEAGTQPGTTVSLPPALLPGIVRVSGTLTSDLRGNAHFETIIPPGQTQNSIATQGRPSSSLFGGNDDLPRSQQRTTVVQYESLQPAITAQSEASARITLAGSQNRPMIRSSANRSRVPYPRSKRIFSHVELFENQLRWRREYFEAPLDSALERQKALVLKPLDKKPLREQAHKIEIVDDEGSPRLQTLPLMSMDAAVRSAEGTSVIQYPKPQPRDCSFIFTDVDALRKAKRLDGQVLTERREFSNDLDLDSPSSSVPASEPSKTFLAQSATTKTDPSPLATIAQSSYRRSQPSDDITITSLQATLNDLQARETTLTARAENYKTAYKGMRLQRNELRVEYDNMKIRFDAMERLFMDSLKGESKAVKAQQVATGELERYEKETRDMRKDLKKRAGAQMTNQFHDRLIKKAGEELGARRRQLECLKECEQILLQQIHGQDAAAED